VIGRSTGDCVAETTCVAELTLGVSALTRMGMLVAANADRQIGPRFRSLLLENSSASREPLTADVHNLGRCLVARSRFFARGNTTRGDRLMLDALVIAPHPDDAELGMGGTILRLLGQGWSVGILDLTSGEPTPLGTPEKRVAETAAANAMLGNPWRQNLGLTNRSLEPSLENRRILAAEFRKVRPRLLFAPYWEDAHPDHTAATKLVEDARFWSKLSKSDISGEPFHPARIFYYFSVHLRIVERPSFVVDISDQHQTKVAALQCYRSQLVDNVTEGRPGVIDAVADRTRFWGHSIGVRHGEPFASREPIGISSLDFLLL
jgi:N-acetylglucosamine malate deacetylase 1